MLRLPPFRFRRPSTLEEACRILDGEGAAEGGPVRVVAGGTDLWPNMKRRQEEAATVVSLLGIPGLDDIANGSPAGSDGSTATARRGGDAAGHGGGVRIGATTTLDRLARSPLLRQRYPALAAAAAEISTVALRNMGTLGGNLCLNTRCTYFGQSEDWRCAIDYCMKEKGTVCWVAPSSDRCWAIAASDTAPMLAALGARALLVSRAGERTVPVAELYRDDGIDWLTKRPDEILAEVMLPAESASAGAGHASGSPGGCRSAFRKLRRRGSIDFAALTVAAAVWTDAAGVIERAALWLGSVASSPLCVVDAETFLTGRRLDAESIAEAARLARRAATPLDNADFTAQWRSRMVEVWVVRALDACAQ